MSKQKEFLKRAESAINQEFLQIALDRNASRRKNAIGLAFSTIKDPAALREKGRRIRAHAAAHLPELVNEFSAKCEENGFIVHKAEDAAQASAIAVSICQEHNATLAAKSKSMVTEEVELNAALEKAGIKTIETDLGEYIVQLRDEKPTHIITPAVHLRKEDVAETFVEKLGMEYSTDVRVMNDMARKTLREVFLQADVGISGVNFGIVDEGAICLLTNEGNGRMVTTVPPVHIALMGLERLVQNFDELAVMLQLLPRSATGQKITSYVNIIRSPGQPGEAEGPLKRHIILVDNGRMQVQQSAYAEILQCIRCGACINVCPVYQELGGAAYGSVYPGPIGSVLSAALFGTEEFGHLSKASTLCGACGEVCPVKIDLPELLVKTRQDYVREVPQPLFYRTAIKAFSIIMKSARLYEFANKTAALFMRFLPGKNGWLSKLPFVFKGWTSSRYFPKFAQKSFHSRMLSGEIEQTVMQPPPQSGLAAAGFNEDLPAEDNTLSVFTAEVEKLGGEVHQVDPDQLPIEIVKALITAEVKKAAVSKPFLLRWPELEIVCEKSGIALIEEDGSQEFYNSLKHDIQAGINIAHSGAADTGTLVFPGDAKNSQLISLLPGIHIAVVQRTEIRASFEDWLQRSGGEAVGNWSNFCLASGPSRTADIEMTLTIGVHGPGELVVFVI